MLSKQSNLQYAAAITVGIALIYAAMIPPLVASVDGSAMLELAQSIVVNHNFRVSSESGSLGVDGYYYSRWYLLPALLAVPSMALGNVIGEAFDLPPYYVGGFFALAFTAILAAMTVGLILLMALRLGSDRKMAAYAALSFALSSIALTYAGTYYPEPILAFLFIASLYFMLGKTTESVVTASLLAGLAILAKPTAIILGLLLSLYWWGKKQTWILVVLPIIVAVGFVFVYGYYNYIRFGNPVNFGQSWINDVPGQIVATKQNSNLLNSLSLKLTPPLMGMWGLLFSSGRGLVWYCPSVLLAGLGIYYVAKINRLVVFVILSIFGSFLLLHSGAWWSGGWAWGPRYLVPTLPGLFVLVAFIPKRWRYVLLSLSLIGFLVNAPTRIAFYERYYVQAMEQKIAWEDQLWNFDYAPFRQGWQMAYEQINDAKKFDVKNIVKTAGTREMRGEMTRVVAMWWWMVPAIGIPLWIGGAVAAGLVIGGGWLIYWAIES
jgi:hypothetical protein